MAENTKNTSFSVVKDTAKVKKAPLIYIGPTLRVGFLLPNMTIIRDDNIDVFVNKRKNLSNVLFVKPEDLTKARKELKDKKSDLAKAYREAYKEEMALQKKEVNNG